MSTQLGYLLSGADAILLLIGTNSSQFLSARHITSQVKDILIFLRVTYLQLNEHHWITIPLVFPFFVFNFFYWLFDSSNIEKHSQSAGESGRLHSLVVMLSIGFV